MVGLNRMFTGGTIWILDFEKPMATWHLDAVIIPPMVFPLGNFLEIRTH